MDKRVIITQEGIHLPQTCAPLLRGSVPLLLRDLASGKRGTTPHTYREGVLPEVFVRLFGESCFIFTLHQAKLQ